MSLETRNRPSMPMKAPPRRLGAGRSGEVWAARDENDRLVAIKVFGASGVTQLVQVVLLGAPNPYAWCEDAVRCAVLRRRILAPLVRVWFGQQLRVAEAFGHAWNEGSRSWELRAELVDGRPPRLRHPLNFGSPERDEALELQNELLPELQDRLLDAGFEGLVWQAGRGNPVALNNFLRERDGAWAWIDLESGIPALVPADPRALVRTYLPLAWKLGRPPFDDVDAGRLAAWVDENGPGLIDALGDEGVEAIRADVTALSDAQARWKERGRLRSSIESAVARGTIEPDDAEWYAARPLVWYASLAAGAAASIPRALGRAATRLAGLVRRLRLAALARHTFRFVTSHRHRVKVARVVIGRRLVVWRRRGQLTHAEMRELRTRLEREACAAHLSHFAAHVGLNAFSKSLESTLLPILLFNGVIGPAVFAILLVMMGPLLRTTYTATVVLRAAVIGRERPWVALFSGAVPTIGNLAFPFQILHGAEKGSEPAQFLVYDGFARIGSHLPIWGGRDTATEHFFNRLPESLVVHARRRSAGQPRAAQATAGSSRSFPQKSSPSATKEGAPKIPRRTASSV